MTDLSDLLHRLEFASSADQADLLRAAAMATGGFFDTPQAGNSWDAQTYQIKAHDIYGTAQTKQEAVLNWMKAARRVSDTWDEIIIAGHVIRGDLGDVSEHRMRAACAVILGPSFHPKCAETQLLYTAAVETLKILDAMKLSAA